VYPELAFYLDWNLITPDNKVDNWIIEYFKEYNYSKAIHSKSHKIEEIINIKNKDKTSFSDWFYSIPRPGITQDTKYIWLDGVGAEWFPLLIYLTDIYGKEKGKIIKTKMLTRTNLPSITECNKYEFYKISDLDNYIHNKQVPYKYPDVLIKEIEIIEGIVKKIIELPHEKIHIVSDHGFSFLCMKDFGNFKKLDFENAEHEGRCMWVNSEDYSDDDYFIVWNIDEGDCRNKKVIVTLKHISLYKTPYREVHGGATPEEVLVPYIVIETEKDRIEYEIKPAEFVVFVSNPVIQFRIDPYPLHIPKAFENDRLLDLSYEKKSNLFNLNLKGLEVGEHLIILKIGDRRYQIKVTIRGGFKEIDLL
jgi:hypothetical protein